LTSAQHKAAESLYRQQAAGSAAGSPGGAGSAGAEPSGPGASGAKPGSSSGDVIDAEVVDEGKQ
jgi:hypothetical protein